MAAQECRQAAPAHAVFRYPRRGHTGRSRSPPTTVRCLKGEVRPCITRDAAYIFTIHSTRVLRDRSRPKPHGRPVALVNAYEPIAWILIPYVTGHGASVSIALEVRRDEKFDHIPYFCIADIALRRSDQSE